MNNNKETIIVLAPICFTGIGFLTKGTTSLIKSVNKKVNLKKEQNLKELYCYDPSLGHYWKLSRKLTNKEWIKIDKRKTEGERLADILNDMKVLK